MDCSAQHVKVLIASGLVNSTDLHLGTLGNVTFRYPTGWDRCVPSRLIESLLPKGLSTPGAKLSLHLTPISRSARQSFSFTRYTTSALVPIAGLYVRGTMRHDMGLNVRKGRPSGYLPSLP
jgi:hypothetical protein